MKENIHTRLHSVLLVKYRYSKSFIHFNQIDTVHFSREVSQNLPSNLSRKSHVRLRGNNLKTYLNDFNFTFIVYASDLKLFLAK